MILSFGTKRCTLQVQTINTTPNCYFKGFFDLLVTEGGNDRSSHSVSEDRPEIDSNTHTHPTQRWEINGLFKAMSREAHPYEEDDTCEEEDTCEGEGGDKLAPPPRRRG